MDLALSIALILSALLAGAMSPGPSFVLVAKIAMGTSRSDGVAAAAGMGVGGIIFAVICLTGLQALLATIPAVYMVLKLAGGCYLLYIALGIWKNANSDFVFNNDREEKVTRQDALKKSFLTALLTQLSNPKTAFVYAGIFATLLPKEIPLVVNLILPVSIFFLEAGWYSVVALILSSKLPRAAYLKRKTLLDIIAGSIMAGLGLKLISTIFDQQA